MRLILRCALLSRKYFFFLLIFKNVPPHSNQTSLKDRKHTKSEPLHELFVWLVCFVNLCPLLWCLHATSHTLVDAAPGDLGWRAALLCPVAAVAAAAASDVYSELSPWRCHWSAVPRCTSGGGGVTQKSERGIPPQSGAWKQITRRGNLEWQHAEWRQPLIHSVSFLGPNVGRESKIKHYFNKTDQFSFLASSQGTPKINR